MASCENELKSEARSTFLRRAFLGVAVLAVGTAFCRGGYSYMRRVWDKTTCAPLPPHCEFLQAVQGCYATGSGLAITVYADGTFEERLSSCLGEIYKGKGQICQAENRIHLRLTSIIGEAPDTTVQGPFCFLRSGERTVLCRRSQISEVIGRLRELYPLYMSQADRPWVNGLLWPSLERPSEDGKWPGPSAVELCFESGSLKERQLKEVPEQ